LSVSQCLSSQSLTQAPNISVNFYLAGFLTLWDKLNFLVPHCPFHSGLVGDNVPSNYYSGAPNALLTEMWGTRQSSSLHCDFAKFWTPHFLFLDSTLLGLDSTFWLDSTLKLNYAPEPMQQVPLPSLPSLYPHPFIPTLHYPPLPSDPPFPPLSPFLSRGPFP